MSRPFTKLSDSFKILRDNLNTTSYNVGDPDNLLTYGDSDVVMAINEIERVFDASAGEILYPTGNALQGETATRLLISTAQASGTDIQFNVGANFNVNAVGDINLDAGGANINFLDDSVARFNFTLGGTNVVDVTGILDLNISSDLDADIAGNSILTTTGSQTQEGTTLNLDFSGDITLDADGNDILFKNGAGGDTVTHTLANNAKYTIAAPDDYTIDAVGDIVLDAGGDNITLKDAGTTRIGYTLGATNTITTTGNLTNNTSGAVVDSAASYTGTFTGAYATTAGGNQTATVGGNYVLDANGDITLDANGNDIILRDGASDRIKHTLGATNTTAVTGNYTVDASGDIVLDAGGNDLDIKGAGTTRFAYGLGTTNTIDVTGNLTQAVGGNLTQTIAGAYSDSATGAYHIGATGAVDIVSASTLVTSSKAQTHTSNGAYNVNVTGAAKIAASTTITLDAAGDIILDAAGDDVILKDAGTEYGRFKHAGANQLGIYSNGILTATLNDSDIVFNNDVNIENDLDVDRDLNVDRNTTLNGNVDLGNATGDTISFLGRVDTNIVPSTDGTRDLGSSSLEMRHGFFDGTVTTDGLVADSADIGNFNIIANAISNSNAVTLTTGALTATVTGNALIDASGDITLDADGNDIFFKNGAGGDTVTHTLADNGLYTVQAPSGYVVNAVGDIVLDADGGDIVLRDDGVQFGKMTNSLKRLHIYSGSTQALHFDSSANATFTQDLTVNGNTDLDGTLNVDGATDLNGHVDLGNATSDNISIIGRVDTNIVPDADDTYDFGTSALQWRHGFFDGTVTTDSLVTDSADIANFNVVSNTISNPNAVTLDGGNAIHLDTHTGSLTMKKAGTTRLAYTLGANNVLNATGSLTTGATTLIKDSATTSHTTVAGTSIVHTAGTTLTNTSGGAMQQTSGGNWTATVTGAAKIDASTTITLDANTDIVLDANSGNVYLKDNGTQFGRFQNSSNQLDIYSGTTLAVAMDASKVEIHGRAFFVDSGVNTVAQNIAGSINEIHTQLDSAVSEILVNKGNIATNDAELADHLSRLDSDSTQLAVNIGRLDSDSTQLAVNIGRLDSDATFLQSNLGKIDTNTANIATNVSNITALATLVGTLNTLDSSAPGGFFKGINNDSIVKALNELATRTVLIYDESGTLLN